VSGGGGPGGVKGPGKGGFGRRGGGHSGTYQQSDHSVVHLSKILEKKVLEKRLAGKEENESKKKPPNGPSDLKRGPNNQNQKQDPGSEKKKETACFLQLD